MFWTLWTRGGDVGSSYPLCLTGLLSLCSSGSLYPIRYYISHIQKASLYPLLLAKITYLAKIWSKQGNPFALYFDTNSCSFHSVIRAWIEKGQDLTRSYVATPCCGLHQQKIHVWGKKREDAIKNALTQWLRMVNERDKSHQTGVVNRFTSPTFPLPQQLLNKLEA